MEFDWINLLQVFGGIILGGGSVIGWKAAKRKGMIEAKDMQWQSEDKRLQTLLDAEVRLTERMSQMNATIDRHIDRNREISDRLYKSETEQNRLNEKLLVVTEERDAAIRKADYYEMWRCEREDCQDPRGPRPPREKLKGIKYEPPKNTSLRKTSKIDLR